MIKVKNMHVGPLVVAGVQIGPGRTAAVDETAFRNWSIGAGAKAWLKAGIIAKAEEPEKDRRKELMAEAKALGLKPAGNTGEAKLEAMIEEAKNTTGDGGEGSVESGHDAT